MLKIQFTNAQVEDNGYGLTVNGKRLEEIISTALGTKVGNNYGHGSGLPRFESNCCNVTVIIEPQQVTELIAVENEVWDNVEEFEEDMYEQYQTKARATES